VPHLRSCLSHRQAVQKHFGKQLRFVFRNFPLAQLHPEAESAAETAEFAGAHGHFWEVHDALYENQDELGLPFYLALAEALNLPEPALREALETRAFGAKVRSDFMGGTTLLAVVTSTTGPTSSSR
jgi:protein-disulfide isomerase